MIEPTNQPLTERQKEILKFIADGVMANGFPPTTREIGQKFGIGSPNGVASHLHALEKKGYIKKSPKYARTTKIVQRNDIGICPCCGQRVPNPTTTP